MGQAQLEARVSTLVVRAQLEARDSTLVGQAQLEARVNTLVASVLADLDPILEVKAGRTTTQTLFTLITLTPLAGMAGRPIANKGPILESRIATSAM